MGGFLEKKEVEEKDAPSYSVVQVNCDKYGKPVFVVVGGLFRSQNPNSKTAFILRIGKMRLIVFKHKKHEKGVKREDELLSKAV